MLKYIARRLLMLIPVLLGVTLLVFRLCISRRAIRWTHCLAIMQRRRHARLCVRSWALTAAILNAF